MANNVTTFYAIDGDKKAVNGLYKILKKEASGVEPVFVSDLMNALGADTEKLFSEGRISGVTKKEDCLRFLADTPWERNEDLEKVIKGKYPGLDVHFLVEDIGNESIETNDAEEKYFPERVAVISKRDEVFDQIHYYTREEAHRVLCDILEADPDKTSWEEAKALAAKRNHLRVYEVEIIA